MMIYLSKDINKNKYFIKKLLHVRCAITKMMLFKVKKHHKIKKILTLYIFTINPVVLGFFHFHRLIFLLYKRCYFLRGDL